MGDVESDASYGSILVFQLSKINFDLVVWYMLYGGLICALWWFDMCFIMVWYMLYDVLIYAYIWCLVYILIYDLVYDVVYVFGIYVL